MEVMGRLQFLVHRSTTGGWSRYIYLLGEVGLKLERAEMQMIRWMCAVFKKDRRTSEELRKLVGVEHITTVFRSVRLI